MENQTLSGLLLHARVGTRVRTDDREPAEGDENGGGGDELNERQPVHQSGY